MLPQRTDPISELTRTLRQRLYLPDVFDIDELVASYADVQELAWDFDCDALVMGLGAARPQLFLRAVPGHSWRRRRFTLGHELGHLLIPWHLGRTACHAMSLDDAPNTAAFGAAGRQIARQEAEATRFASSLLVPQEVLLQRARAGSLQELFESLDEFDISTMATLLALRTSLMPGFVFWFDDGEPRCFESSGTDLPPAARGNMLRIGRLAHESGRFECGGRDVRWFMVNEPATFEPVDDPRPTSEILREAISATGLPSDMRLKMFQSINGIVAGKLSRERATTEDQALTIVRATTRDNARIPPEVRDHPDFDLYLRRKAEERIAKRAR